MKALRLWLICIGLALCSCDADNQYGSPYECNFIFLTDLHPSSLLTLSLGNPGEFVTVESKSNNGIIHLMITANYGKTEDLQLVTEEEKRLSFTSMGAGHRLIIGCSNFNGMKAYDGHCSNCLINLGGLNYPLIWTDNGLKLKCSKCNRIYDPHAEGVPVENAEKGDRALYQYMVQKTENGRHNTLRVYNGQARI